MKETHLPQVASSHIPFPTWNVIIKTSRPFTLTAAMTPVFVGTALAAYNGTFHLVTFLMTLFSCLFLQIGTNYFNEYFDYRYGLDHAESLGAMTVIFRNEMTARTGTWRRNFLFCTCGLARSYTGLSCRAGDFPLRSGGYGYRVLL